MGRTGVERRVLPIGLLTVLLPLLPLPQPASRSQKIGQLLRHLTGVPRLPLPPPSRLLLPRHGVDPTTGRCLIVTRRDQTMIPNQHTGVLASICLMFEINVGKDFK